MKVHKIIDIIGTALLLIGFILAFLPHAFHSRIGLEDVSHTSHVVTGIILVILAVSILIYNNKSLKLPRKKI